MYYEANSQSLTFLLRLNSVHLLTCVKISLAKTLFPCFIIMLMNLLKSRVDNDHLMQTLDITSFTKTVLLGLPEDWIVENRAGNSTGCCFDGPECFEVALLLLLSAQLRLCSVVDLLPDLWLQIVRVVSAPSHQEHSANKGHMRERQRVWTDNSNLDQMIN